MIPRPSTVFDVVDIGNGVIRVQSIEGTDTIKNVEQLSIDGTLVPIESALLYHGLPPATDSALQQPAVSSSAEVTDLQSGSLLTTTEIELLSSEPQTASGKRTTLPQT